MVSAATTVGDRVFQSVSRLNKGPELICGLSCDHSRRQSNPMGNITSGHHYLSGTCSTGNYVMTW